MFIISLNRQHAEEIGERLAASADVKKTFDSDMTQLYTFMLEKKVDSFFDYLGKDRTS